MDRHANDDDNDNDNDNDNNNADTTGGWIIVRSEFLIPSRTKITLDSHWPPYAWLAVQPQNWTQNPLKRY